MPELPHPLTGVALDADDLAALVQADEEFWPYQGRWKRVRERIAELRGPADLPRPSRQSDVQARVARCPRCGGAVGKAA